MSLQVLKASAGSTKKDAVIPTSKGSRVFASDDNFENYPSPVKEGKEGGSFDAALEDWGVREGATGECKLRGKWLSQLNGVKTGIWECTPGKFDVIDRKNVESIHILKGVVGMTDLKTKEFTVMGPGDCATLELGSSVRWEIIETVTKFFVVALPTA